MKVTIPKIIEGDFNEVINKTIQEGRHVDYLKTVLKEYEEYKKVFAEALTDQNSLERVYLFKVTYLLKKPVWREIAILGSQTFNELAEGIINSMDWDNDHMHGFSFPQQQNKGHFYYSPYTFYAPGWEDDPYPTYKSDQIKICNINYKLHPKLRCEFDFGDGHLFEVQFKEMRDLQKGELIETLPTLIDQRGVAPEQYPPLENDYSEEEQMDDGWFHEDCKLCQDLKNQGAKLKCFPDHPTKKKVVN